MFLSQRIINTEGNPELPEEKQSDSNIPRFVQCPLASSSPVMNERF